MELQYIITSKYITIYASATFQFSSEFSIKEKSIANLSKNQDVKIFPDKISTEDIIYIYIYIFSFIISSISK